MVSIFQYIAHVFDREKLGTNAHKLVTAANNLAARVSKISEGYITYGTPSQPSKPLDQLWCSCCVSAQKRGG